MGKYKKDQVKDILDNGFIRFSAKFTWNASSEADAKARFKHYRDFVGEESNNDILTGHTGIDKETLQGYYLKSPSGDPQRMFVIIGLHNPKKKKSRHGLETYCKRLIFGTCIQGPFLHPVEASELDIPHGEHPDPDKK
jgi:hypothetical protein